MQCSKLFAVHGKIVKLKTNRNAMKCVIAVVNFQFLKSNGKRRLAIVEQQL